MDSTEYSRRFSLETPRLSLAPWTPEDFETLAALLNDPSVLPHLWDGNPVDSSRLQAAWFESEKSFREHGFGLWITRRKATGTLVGFAGLRFLPQSTNVEIVYACAPSERSHGFATEAALAVLNCGFDAGITEIQASTHPGNEPSRRLLRRLGMTMVRTEPTSAGLLDQYSMRARDFSLREV